MTWQVWESKGTRRGSGSYVEYHVYPVPHGRSLVSNPPPKGYRLLAEGECDAMNSVARLMLVC